MTSTSQPTGRIDRAAAVTRSLLGWGVVAGPFYLVVGIVLALTRDGFAITRYPLSLLMLGEHGWIQALNLALTGLMTLAAAIGFARAMRGSRRAFWVGGLIGGFGVCMLASAVFPPDPMDGFPPGASMGDPTLSGMLHFAFGGIGFLLLAAAIFVVAGWCARRNEKAWALWSRISAVVLIVGFFGGAFMPTVELGTLTLWIAVLAIWAWLAAMSIHLYRTVPHPDAGVA
jgi:cytochrome bd-type quinol oxidase subunit 2